MNQYIKHYENKQSNTGLGMRQKNKRGGNVIFFNNPKQLLEKLELIIGEISAGDTLLKASAIK